VEAPPVNVSRFDLGACPRVSAAKARSMRAALPAVAALPRRWETEAPFGHTAVNLEGFVQDDADSDDVTLPVTLGIGTSRMTVDADFAARLVDALLVGNGAFRSARRFGPAERGVLAGLLGTLFFPLGWRIGHGRVPPVEGAAAQACFRVETPIAVGRVRLAVAAATFETARASEAFVERARALVAIAVAEIAVTDLTAREVSDLGAGDAVVFTGHRAASFPSDGVWKGELSIGEPAASHGMAIEIDAGGTIKIAGGFQARTNTVRSSRKETGMESSGVTAATVALAAAPIEVVAEVGRLRLRGEELMGLAPGAVLPLPEGRTRVSLRIAGELFAEGELVDVDGELGVRVTRMAAR
jgi:flagellar motor switch/type III secretory pathway protein FliN